MNAPLSEQALQTLKAASLEDKYTVPVGRVFMSGVQALVRLPLLQRARDERAGLKTAGFISGYRGSPLGNYDQALQKAKRHLDAQNVVFQPGVNEELAATAIWGTQQLAFAPKAEQTHDGVFGIWYGKGPGVDRSSDVFKHSNMAGTTPLGGVLAVAGDDHVSKSSTVAHQSDQIFQACGFPVFFPASVQDILDAGLHAIALSRYAGVWVGMKTIQEIVESSATVVVDPARVTVKIPDFALPPDGVHIRWPDPPLVQEQRLFDVKLPAARAYIEANRLNHNVIEGPADRFGIVASGKAYNDTRQALQDLGLDDATCQRAGIRVHKVLAVWPLAPATVQSFAKGLQEIVVVEEKRALIEPQIKDILYSLPDTERPRVVGKLNGDVLSSNAETLVRANADLSASLVAQALAKRLTSWDLPADIQVRIDQALTALAQKEQDMSALAKTGMPAERTPWFCSGCPHNTSTKVPEGSRAMAGIGCHFMSVWMDRSTVGFTQMGGEGVPWVGQAPFTREPHVFANLGDGTYFHSGLLAIRQSVAAGVNITYKVLYNDAVAMTGGQQVGERPEGHSVVQIAGSVTAEGAKRVTVVTDQPEKYQGVTLPAGVAVAHRDELAQIQMDFRAIPGTTVIIYDQTCATEKRRRRKRGTLVDPDVRVVINEAVCEGCGDCGVQSNCLSIEPLETPLGRKRTVNQHTCNKDQSCVKGFCPSFVTVIGADSSKRALQAQPKAALQLPQPNVTHLPAPTPSDLAAPWRIMVAGVGGTGVITIGQLLGMAAHMEGKGVVTLDSAGLAQKGGATWSHITLARQQDALHATRVDTAAADLILGCDPVVTASKETLLRMHPARTHVALNGHSTPTAAFVHNTDWQNPATACRATIAAAVSADALQTFDADAVATQLLGNSLFVNPVVLGFAWQKGWIPLHEASLMRAIELNGVQVAANQAAFAWGRLCAHDWTSVEATLSAVKQAQAPAQPVLFTRKASLDDTIALRESLLTAYQNGAYAKRYTDQVARVRAAERAVVGPDSALPITQTVAEQLYRVMAIKDEYEVARLHADPAFSARLTATFGTQIKRQYHLAPPLLGRKNATGQAIKTTFGGWMAAVFPLLAAAKGLRGTALDVFGYTDERKSERKLRDDYIALIDTLCHDLSAENRALALELANVVAPVKGFGHVKARNMAAARLRWSELLARWQAA
jgi:indolepyruvate ferredoxin oxidoreductase